MIRQLSKHLFSTKVSIIKNEDKFANNTKKLLKFCVFATLSITLMLCVYECNLYVYGYPKYFSKYTKKLNYNKGSDTP